MWERAATPALVSPAFFLWTPDVQGLSWAVLGPWELDAKAQVALKGITVACKRVYTRSPCLTNLTPS